MPNSTAQAWINGGENGLIIAADVAGVSLAGHITSNPTDEIVIALEIPTEGGIVPSYSLLHNGTCTEHEQRCDKIGGVRN